MKKFVGDLSDSDALLIEQYASSSGVRSVLEFGAGGSTQIIAQCLDRAGAELVSVETDPRWIATTRERLGLLGVSNRCRFVNYAGWRRTKVVRSSQPFSLVFVDGLGAERLNFARAAWPLLSVGGVMLFHDTRRPQDVANVLALVSERNEEVASVIMNEAPAHVSHDNSSSSNTTVVLKKKRERYVNWKSRSGRPKWRYGAEAVPPEFWRSS